MKPAISASAHRTRKITLEKATQHQTFWENLLKISDVMIQFYLLNVETEGETSFIFINGEFAHVVQRRSALTEGIEVTDRGGPVNPTARAVIIAKRVIAISKTTPLYARIDLVYDSDGKECLLEKALLRLLKIGEDDQVKIIPQDEGLLIKKMGAQTAYEKISQKHRKSLDKLGE